MSVRPSSAALLPALLYLVFGYLLARAETPRRFTLLAPAQTGITATNNYADLHGPFEQIMRGALGTGVAIADLDGDGRPDLVTVGKGEGLRFFRNLGEFKFRDDSASVGLLPERQGTPEAPIWYQGVSAADVNGDGRIDLYVCRIGAPNQLFINQADGRFRDEAASRGVALVDGSNMAAFADYDRDGWLDFYLQTNIFRPDHTQGEPDRLFRNTGDGHFVETTASSGLYGVTQGHGLVWWDYDDDGWPDVYVANDFEEPDRLYRNNRDGTFTNTLADVFPSISNSSMGVDTADVNNDGRIDLFVADMAATTSEKDLRGMVNRRLNGVEPLEQPEALRQYPANTLLLNTGAKRFVDIAHLAGVARTDWTWSVLFADFNQDGLVDLHVTNGVFRELHNIDLSARSARATSNAEQLAIIRQCPVYREANLFYLGQGEGRFSSCANEVGLDDVGVSFGAAVGDLDGDGDLDLVYTQFRQAPAVYRNDLAQGSSVRVDLRSHGPNRFGIGAKVVLKGKSGQQVRDLQQTRGYLASSEPMLHFGLPTGEDVVDLEVSWPSGTRQQVRGVRAGSRITVQEPERSNLATASAPVPPLWVEVSGAVGMQVRAREAMTRELARQPLAPEVFNRAGPALAVADLNGDGLEDFITGATTRDAGTVFLSNGRGGFARSDYDAGATLNRGPLVAADFDRDGLTELLVTSGGSTAPLGDEAYRPRLFRLNEAGVLTPSTAQLPAFPGPVGALAVADFDRDGWLDVVLGGRVVPGRFPENAPAACWRGGPGGFTTWSDFISIQKFDTTDSASLGLVTALLASDVDMDGWPDLVVAAEWGRLQYWHNEQGRGFIDRSAEAGLTEVGVGLWGSLAAADFNGDGRPDFLVGNEGTNTGLAALTGETAVLYYGKFSGATTPQVIEAVRRDGVEWPRRGRQTLSTVFRDLPRRFPENDRFAAAGLTGIFRPEELAKADRRELQEKRSGVLLSGPNGHYTFAALPWQAQLAPWQGVAIADVNDDGCLDVVGAQNSHDPVPEHGRADASVGTVLLGDGRGGFRFLPWAESGWILPGDGRGLSVADFDRNGRPDFFVTRNNRASQVFLHQQPGQARGVRVTLGAGPEGREIPWGARLTARYANGRTQALEFFPVTSPHSQGAPLAFFGEAPDNPLLELEVVWPDQQKSRHVGPWALRTLRLRPDGSTEVVP